MTAILTLEQLRGANACTAQVNLFRKLFGNKVEVTEELALVHVSVFDWKFAATYFLDAPAQAEYRRACASAQAEYRRACASAQAEHNKARASAQAEHNKARAAAWAEYNKARAPAQAEYNAAHAAAWAEYRRACASAWARGYIATVGRQV